MVFDRIVAGLSLACALTVTAVVVRREFTKPTVDPGVAQDRIVENWTEVTGAGRVLGSARAPVTLVVFSDYQCPGCRRFDQRSLAGLLAEQGRDVRVVIRHWPLEHIHPIAYRAAQAAECAGDQGRFEAMHHTLFANQDSIGRKALSAMAKESGVKDSAAFAVCLGRSDRDPDIMEDVRVATGLALTGTPSVMINGVLYGNLPDSAGLSRLVRDEVRKARNPIASP